MSPAKNAMKNAPGKIKEKQNQLSKEDSGNSSGKDTQEFEIENDEQPLQIDTSNNDAKLEQVETERQDVDKENAQADANKRISDSSENNPTPTKKARPKPKPQIIENMQEYIDSNTIEKLTTTTLLHWLKERNLHCSTRDKKAELIQKVKNQFVCAKT
ncbi:hypothetical protein MML48_3g00010228 [Holotrichia oblita]|uniref:Uncharacterized protein n=2 Tax=Holotrichia oblita TaxID=644536 RepID=A0ACB9TFU5_HOLOL|nr:hypothetical protein MML48_3g00009040 [Holotrichia oblita]KAI4465654.1 hypothetical protein MML48_3g00010228 [Holotrichia oblita]